MTIYLHLYVLYSRWPMRHDHGCFSRRRKFFEDVKILRDQHHVYYLMLCMYDCMYLCACMYVSACKSIICTT